MSESSNFKAFKEAVQVKHAGKIHRLTVVDGRTTLGEFDPNHKTTTEAQKRHLLDILHGPETSVQERIGTIGEMLVHAKGHKMNGTDGSFLEDTTSLDTAAWAAKLNDKEEDQPPLTQADYELAA